MVMKDDVALMTATEFEDFLKHSENLDRLWELIEGVPVEKMPTEEHGIIVINIGTELRNYTRQYKIGRVGTEIRSRLANDNLNSRMPDVSFFVDKTRAVVTEGAVPQLPDLAVEVKSPTDSLKEIRAKVRYYLANGTRLVWVVLPQQKTIEVYSAEEEAVLTLTDTLMGGTVLPNFSTPVSEIFADTVGE
jgi:Uma2 family endonuclease